MANKEYISDELLATFLDGNTNEKETKQVLNALKTDKQLQEVLHIALQLGDEVNITSSLNKDKQGISHKTKTQQYRGLRNKIRNN